MNVSKESRPAVFFDRDGVLIIDKDFQIDKMEIELFPDSISALAELDSKYARVVISNQSGVARGYFTAADVESFNAELNRLLSESNVMIDAWYFCPHGTDDNCECRKPKPGMLLRASRELSLDLKNSWIIGDKSSDITAGQAAGVKAILIQTGYAGAEPGAAAAIPDFSADDLSQAIRIINRSVV